MVSVDEKDLPDQKGGPVDRLVIQLRAYVEPPKPKTFQPKESLAPTDLALAFDTETTTDPSQRLRFGTYQLRVRGHLVEKGIFYNEDKNVFPASDLLVVQETLSQEEVSEAGEQLHCLTHTEFIEKFYKWAEADATIIGFNLPFDLSRLALSHESARRGMKGDFSFQFTTNDDRPRVRVKHLSQRAQFIDFAGTEKTSGRKTGKGKHIPVPRGFFVDVKTLAAALTSQSHSLKSLSKILGLTEPKSESDEHGKPLTPDYVHYAIHDAQVTWECFEILAQKYAAYNLTETGLHQLFSEASLGKAFLKSMGIKPWREVQPDFAPATIGHILSSYFGGRAEVHIRRTIVPVIHCDFLSMYPTVCTLMGLWQFVIAQGMTEHDETDKIRKFVETCELDDLQDPAIWPSLTVLVKVLPENDIFPVRARYEDQHDAPQRDDGETVSATIGLNHLTSPDPLWLTLADVLASKILSGKAPKILEAIRFKPLPPQKGLRSITLGTEEIDPVQGDFYRDLINKRRAVKARMNNATADEKAALQSEQQALKILANATSYGIFVELNVSELEKKQSFKCYGSVDKPFKIQTNKIERTGKYFYPLLGTLITGAARLMLAIAESQVLDEGLDWAFCDTDSLAIANVAGLDKQTFIGKVEKIRAWFAPLNPYEEKGSILQLEKTNFPETEINELSNLDPPLCFAISAKRYVLFNQGQDGEVTIRKASAHGLGHLLAPYGDPDKGKRIDRIGVELWQEDYWKAIIKAAYSDKPDIVDTTGLGGYDQPAASRYAATKPALLKWFQKYNSGVEASHQIGPFNFLLVMQAKSNNKMQIADPAALLLPSWKGRRPKPAAPYFKTAALAAPFAFDRDNKNGAPVPIAWLKTHGRSLVLFHLHRENKFRGGDFDDRGVLTRRHVYALAVQCIGKEADDLDKKVVVGDDDGSIEYQLAPERRKVLVGSVKAAKDLIGLRKFCEAERVSHHTVKAILVGGSSHDGVLSKLAQLGERLVTHATAEAQENSHLIELLKRHIAALGRAAVARELKVDPSYLGRILKGISSMGVELATSVKVLNGRSANAFVGSHAGMSAHKGRAA